MNTFDICLSLNAINFLQAVECKKSWHYLHTWNILKLLSLLWQELRESLRRVAESQPLERAQLAAAEAARHDRRECARLRASWRKEGHDLPKTKREKHIDMYWPVFVFNKCFWYSIFCLILPQFLNFENRSCKAVQDKYATYAGIHHLRWHVLYSDFSFKTDRERHRMSSGLVMVSGKRIT